MGEFRAKVKIKSEKNVEFLIKAFFRNFNPESSITIKGKEAKMTIVFQEPPMEIIDAIGHCEVIKFSYGKKLKACKVDEAVEDETENCSEPLNAEGENLKQAEPLSEENETFGQVEPTSEEGGTSEQVEPASEEGGTSEQVEPTGEEGGTSEQVEPASEEGGNSEQAELASEQGENSEKLEPAKAEVKNPKEIKVVDIPELKEIAKKATSFENFVKLVAEWLKMDKRQEFFEKLAIASAEVEKLSWKELEKALKQKGAIYGTWDKIWCSKQVSEKLKENSVTILPLLNTMAQYKEYVFKQSGGEVILEEKASEYVEETKQRLEDDKDKPRLKMECMPEIKHFEETLASVDKTKPVEERVRYVLEAMELSKKSAQEQKWILEIATTAVRKEKIAFDIIFVEANIPVEQSIEAKMKFSKFINEFAKKYEKECKNVKVLTFLSELQQIIMFESEIESFSDFNE